MIVVKQWIHKACDDVERKLDQEPMSKTWYCKMCKESRENSVLKERQYLTLSPDSNNSNGDYEPVESSTQLLLSDLLKNKDKDDECLKPLPNIESPILYELSEEENENENENEVLSDDEDELDDEFKEHRKNLDLERFKSYLRSNVEMIVKSIRTRKVKELKRKFGIAMIFRV